MAGETRGRTVAAALAGVGVALWLFWRARRRAPIAASPLAASSADGAGEPQWDADRPIASGIRSKVTKALHPEELVVVDDSAAHRGHAGVAGARIAETHFKVQVVASAFEGMNKIARHQRVQGLLKEEFAAGLHALELVLRTPAEYERR
ncbi:unnamed protein product [Effrenium voratum]|nr:unnamed protein product [Effrenium voratum]